ncbi:MAG: hypothetical protein ACI808_002834, partial [Paraglaciecola sp.]
LNNVFKITLLVFLSAYIKSTLIKFHFDKDIKE